MKSPEISMYNTLKPSLGEEDAQVFVEAHNESITAKTEIMKSDLATKGEMLSLKEEMHAFRIEIKEEMHKMHTDLLKSMYVTGLTQTIIIIGAVLAIIKSNS